MSRTRHSAHPEVGGLRIRRFHPQDATELTQLLHRAYAPLAEAGMRYLASWQDAETTLRRATEDGATTFIAELDGRIVGTITLAPPDAAPGPGWYSRPDVAALKQFAVAPELQGRGIGTALAEAAERAARAMGAAYVALDTSEHATHLIATYRKHGFEIVETVDWPITNYRSVIMVKETGRGNGGL